MEATGVSCSALVSTTEYIRVSLLKLAEYFGPMLRQTKTAFKQLYFLKDNDPKVSIADDLDCFLQHVVTVLVKNQALDHETDSYLQVFELMMIKIDD